MAIPPGGKGLKHQDCHIVLVDAACHSSKAAAALDISDGFFTGFGQACADALVMADLIRSSILQPVYFRRCPFGRKFKPFGAQQGFIAPAGKTVIETVVNEVLSCVGPVTIITNNPQEYARSDHRCCGDVLPGGGPLSGIHAALTHCETEYVLVVSCDIPLVNRELFENLISALPGHDIVIFKHKHFEPLCALYRRTCLPALEDLIAHGEYRIIDLFPTLLVKVLRIDSADVFKNINTDADYESVSKGPASPVQAQDERTPRDAAAPQGVAGHNDKP